MVLGIRATSLHKNTNDNTCVRSVLALRRFALRNFAHTLRSAWLSSERELTHPKSSEQNRTRQTKDATMFSQSVKPGEVRESVRKFPTVVYRTYLSKKLYFYSMCNDPFPLLVRFISGNKIVDLYFFGCSGTYPLLQHCAYGKTQLTLRNLAWWTLSGHGIIRKSVDCL
jgi:hypothetical protein